jgi:hypothetical protein
MEMKRRTTGFCEGDSLQLKDTLRRREALETQEVYRVRQNHGNR